MRRILLNRYILRICNGLNAGKIIIKFGIYVLNYTNNEKRPVKFDIV